MFMDAGGYRERRWWSEAGWQANAEEEWTQPRFWDDPRFNGANQPVVGITWYEANAFCRWLSAQLSYVDYEVRLPSEAEWEQAARGNDGRIYPWGNAWEDTRANTYEGGIGTTTPVGCYPDGASPSGALDMSGNVWEWTATPWTSNYETSDGTARETEDGPSFVRRGGAWSFHLRYARCAYRFTSHPSSRYDDLGLRVCAARTLAYGSVSGFRIPDSERGSGGKPFPPARAARSAFFFSSGRSYAKNLSPSLAASGQL
jgi:formylglycine-generating enzyme required for sulfatase activity